MSTTELRTNIQKQLSVFAAESYLYQQQVAQKMGLYPTDFQCIHLLDQYGDLTAGQLGQYLQLTSGSVTALIERLEKMGYVTRYAGPEDRRKTFVTLHEANLAAMREQYRPIQETVDQKLSQLSEEDLAIILRFLQSLADDSMQT